MLGALLLLSLLATLVGLVDLVGKGRHVVATVALCKSLAQQTVGSSYSGATELTSPAT